MTKFSGNKTMGTSSTLFLAWQAPKERRWFTVGRLEHLNDLYTFVYTRGAKQAKPHGFKPLISFPRPDKKYESDSVFPLFSNRLLSPQRPEYHDYINWIDIATEHAEPVSILARTGGTSEKDALEVFPCPEPIDGMYRFHFFIRGIRHQLEASVERALRLERDEPLLLMADIQNPSDEDALVLRTAERTKRDMYMLGYLPRYLASELCNFDRDDVEMPESMWYA